MLQKAASHSTKYLISILCREKDRKFCVILQKKNETKQNKKKTLFVCKTNLNNFWKSLKNNHPIQIIAIFSSMYFIVFTVRLYHLLCTSWL